jgi:hypothetical protein
MDAGVPCMDNVFVERFEAWRRLSHKRGPGVGGPCGARGKSVMPPRGWVRPCVRPVDAAPMAAAPMAAGPDEVCGSDPNPLQRARSAWTPRGSPIPGSTGSSSRLTTVALPLDQRNAASRAGLRLHDRSHVGLVASGLVGRRHRHRYQSGRLALEPLGSPGFASTALACKLDHGGHVGAEEGVGYNRRPAC